MYRPVPFRVLVTALFTVSDQSARKAKIMHLESLAHYGTHSHLIVVSQMAE